MPTEPQRFSYESMGTHWAISIWDDIDPTTFEELKTTIIDQSTAFDHLYSRFKKTSLIWALTEQKGLVEVPHDLVNMLRLYETFYRLSQGKCNPLIGFTISDMGYDEHYSLKPKDHIRSVPELPSALRIVNDTHINLSESVLIDVGALGKGYFVDKIAAFLTEKGLKHFLVDGSGDMLYRGNGTPLRVGLEHPGDPTKVIGVLEMQDGAMCGSASNRRKWSTYHHTIDPTTLQSPTDIIATWTMTNSAAVADGLATCLFLSDPEQYKKEWAFEYCMLNQNYTVKRSTGFTAELF